MSGEIESLQHKLIEVANEKELKIKMTMQSLESNSD